MKKSVLFFLLMFGCESSPKVDLTPLPIDPFVPYAYTMVPPSQLDGLRNEMRKMRGLSTNISPPMPFTAARSPALAPLPGGRNETYAEGRRKAEAIAAKQGRRSE